MSLDNTSRSRRQFVKVGLTGVAALQITGLARGAAATELPRLDEGDGTAKALSYVHDAAEVSAETRGGAGNVCATCRFFTAASDGWGPCTLFPGKAVAAQGWCKGWVAKS